MQKESAQHCQALRRDGRPCIGRPVPGSPYCVAHHPNAAVWRAKGGHGRSNHERAAKLLPARLRPIADTLQEAFDRCYRGELTEKRAAALAVLARALVTVVQAGEYEERVRELEQQTVGVLAWRQREHDGMA